MPENKPIRLFRCGIAFLGITSLCYSLVMTQNTGKWPDSWPKELEPYRSISRTFELTAGNQEDVYEIPVSDRKQFETLWPIILKVKTPEAPLRLSRIKSADPNALFSNALPVVRIYAPPIAAWVFSKGKEGEAIVKLQLAMRDASPEKRKELEEEYSRKWDEMVKQDKILRPGPPWPVGIRTATGALPEYVYANEENGKFEWTPAPSNEQVTVVGFMYRARIEVELVVDGEIINLNRIPLPAGTPIIDKRFVK